MISIIKYKHCSWEDALKVYVFSFILNRNYDIEVVIIMATTLTLPPKMLDDKIIKHYTHNKGTKCQIQ